MNSSTLKSTLTSAALAAAALYFLDPTSGRRRRARLSDQITSTLRRAAHQIGVASRDLMHRAEGMSARARAAFATGETDDQILVERVRAALGRAVSHPGAIDVSVADGRVVLNGPVLAHEHDRLMQAIQAVRGVEAIEDKLETHRQAGRISALQGGRPLRGESRLLDENWPPALRLLATLGGGALVGYGVSQRGLLGLVSAAIGGTLVARATTNTPMKRLTGAQGRRGIDIRKTIHVNAPLEQVFETLSNYENFPAFMRNVRRVTTHADGRSHWVVAGPAGFSVEWDAETSVYRPNEVLGWRTVRSATVAHAGLIRFERDGDSTRLHIQMTYSPPGGALGHAFAKLFGVDAKTELDEDMLRLKTFLETGITPHDAAAHREHTRDAALLAH